MCAIGGINFNEKLRLKFGLQLFIQSVESISIFFCLSRLLFLSAIGRISIFSLLSSHLKLLVSLTSYFMKLLIEFEWKQASKQQMIHANETFVYISIKIVFCVRHSFLFSYTLFFFSFFVLLFQQLWKFSFKVYGISHSYWLIYGLMNGENGLSWWIDKTNEPPWIHFGCGVLLLFVFLGVGVVGVVFIFFISNVCTYEVSWAVCVCNVFISCHYRPLKLCARSARCCFYVENLISLFRLVWFL